MKFINPAFLVSYDKSTNEYGDKVNGEPFERKVFVNKLSVGQKEFYEAQAKGMKPELKFEIRDFEYKNEDTLKYNGVLYNIIRTFDNYKNGTVELICSKSILRVV